MYSKDTVNKWKTIFNPFSKATCDTFDDIHKDIQSVVLYLRRPVGPPENFGWATNKGMALVRRTSPSHRERPEHHEYFSAGEIETWLKQFTEEYYYILDLVKFNYKLLLPYYMELAKRNDQDIVEFYHLNDFEDITQEFLNSWNFIKQQKRLVRCVSCGSTGVNKYSYCHPKTEMSYPICINCHDFYHSKRDRCLKNECRCHDSTGKRTGTAKTYCRLQDSVQSGKEQHQLHSTCASCDKGYVPDGSYCRLPRCNCANGVKAADSRCKGENLEHCVSCHTNFKLQGVDCAYFGIHLQLI